MRAPRIRTQVAFLLFILLPATMGIVAIHASASCERFVRTYVTKPIRNRVSKQTAAAWAAWREAHPNWKPNPNVHRPKYVMTRDEAMNKLNFACTVDPIPTDINLFFKTDDIDAPPPALDLHAMDNTQLTLPNDNPPLVAELVPTAPIGFAPALAPTVPTAFGPPGLPLVNSAVPEPATLLLIASGLLPFGWVIRRKAARSRLARVA